MLSDMSDSPRAMREVEPGSEFEVTIVGHVFGPAQLFMLWLLLSIGCTLASFEEGVEKPNQTKPNPNQTKPMLA